MATSLPYRFNFLGPRTKLEQTIYCQPAVFVSSMAALEKAKRLKDSFLERVTDTAGFSVGEYAALVLAGVMSFQDGWFCCAVLFNFK